MYLDIKKGLSILFDIIEAANTLPLLNGKKIQWEPLLITEIPTFVVDSTPKSNKLKKKWKALKDKKKSTIFL